MLNDLEITKRTKKLPIEQIAVNAGIDPEHLESYGRYKAKVSQSAFDSMSDNPDGRLILVTAVNPTPAGEGKTTTTIGLGQAMTVIGKKAIVALREPSLGPVFGMKGGAAGGGYSQVVPMEDINLHFTGDMHAITAANNLLCAIIDNHLHWGNTLGIDQRRITFKRCLDMNDRALRNINIGLGGKINGIPREDGFNITVASEIMAILCLSSDTEDLKKRLGNIIVGFTFSGEPVFARQLEAEGAMTALLKDAINPNLVQTLENTPALIHGGPFANIAHGCNSIRATRLALGCADYCITEAGFGSDLGAEKFFDIKCRYGGFVPSCVVIVVTVRALKYNGGADRADLANEDLDALAKGFPNLEAHIENMKKYGIPIVAAVNRFESDSDAELAVITRGCAALGVDCAISECHRHGGAGGKDLAEKVAAACERPSQFRFLYPLESTIPQKIEAISRNIYGADNVVFTLAAQKDLQAIESMGFGELPVCVAKTPYSLSDDPAKQGRPKGFNITVRELRLCSGAGFVVALTGDVVTMPGLPKKPAAAGMDVISDEITGLF